MRNDAYRVRVWYEGKQFDIGQFDSLTVAKVALEQARIDIARREFISPADRRRMVRARQAAEAARRVTVTDWAEEWLDRLEHHHARPRSPSTITSYRSTLNAHVLPVIGDRLIGDVTENDITALLDAAYKKGPGSGRNAAATLRAMLRAAVAARVGGLTAMPATIEVGAGGRRDTDSLPTDAEVRALADAMPEHLRLSVDLAAGGGLRLGEVLGLQVRDLDLDLDAPNGPDLHVRRQWLSKGRPPRYGVPKAGSARTVALPDALAERARAHIAAHTTGEADAPLFPSVSDPARPLSHSAYAARWDVARKSVGRPSLNFHTLRHWHLTRYSQAGGTSAETSDRGGHNSAEVARRYQHTERVRDREIANRMWTE